MRDLFETSRTSGGYNENSCWDMVTATCLENSRLRTVYRPTRRYIAPLKSNDGAILPKDKEGRSISSPLKTATRISKVDVDSLDNVAAVPIRVELDLLLSYTIVSYCQLCVLEPCSGQWPNFEEAASDGGRYSGQLLMMWSAVCSGSPHSHAALSGSHHFFMDVLNRPTPARSLFRVVQCFRLRSSPLTPSPGSDICGDVLGCFPLLHPRCRYPCIIRPVLGDDT